MSDNRPEFEQEIDLFVQTKRPGCKAIRCDCKQCGFFGYVAHEVDNLPEYCPQCGLDGFGVPGMKKTLRGEFINNSKRLWDEDTCRTMLNAALLYLAVEAGGKIMIDCDKLAKAAQAMGGVAMAISDDDKTLTITGMNLT